MTRAALLAMVACVGCKPAVSASGGSGGSGDLNSGTTESAGSSGESETAADSQSGTLDTGYPAPDCTTLSLPGTAADIAATPREDRDAEVLALALAPELLVARQDRYEVISEDLSAIRTLAPEVSEIHAECAVPLGYAFSLDAEFVGQVWLGDYHAWDCHNEWFGVQYERVGNGGDVWRVDGLTFVMRVNGVYDTSLADRYSDLPGMETAGIDPLWDLDAWTDSECEVEVGTISLGARLGQALELETRTYRFDRVRGESLTFVVEPGKAPAPG